MVIKIYEDETFDPKEWLVPKILDWKFFDQNKYQMRKELQYMI